MSLTQLQENNKRAVMRSDIALACYHVVGIIQITASVKLQVILYIVDLWCQVLSIRMMLESNVPRSIVEYTACEQIHD